jgi:V-type H+-transporting ATPase subunit a
MCLGICLKAVNAIHFGLYLDFWFEFVPQFIFMVSFFGYFSNYSNI